jgi:inhibitor of KinA
MKYELKYKRYGASSILIEWPQRIERLILDDILGFKSKVEERYSKDLNFINHAYASLLLSFKGDVLDFSSEVEKLKEIYESSDGNQLMNRTLWKIPVCYDESFGIDLVDLAITKNSTTETIIQLHTAPIYTVFFIGFLPGFLYLGDLDKALHTPRKSTPRLKIKKGAVAIGGEQTGIYPIESPGGWNIIGNSPINFFDLSREAPSFAKAGDSLQFYSVSIKKYNDIKALVEAGVYQIESEVRYD